MRPNSCRCVFVCIFGLAVLAAEAQVERQSPSDLHAQMDTIARKALAASGVPSASIAIVKDGRIAYLQAYGDARLEPRTAATPEMRYAIGSISKQFTAAAVLMLAEQRKLSLDDPVARFLPELTRAKDVTIRELLSHTSGYQDYWPQDYVPPFMLQPITAGKIMDLWARKPLDFDPGTKWQYSNTNYVIAGAIVEKASGMPLIAFLQQRVFTPLGMKSVTNIDQEKLGTTDPAGYMRYGLGPLRPSPKEGKGWLFAAGELAMSAEDLAKWDISVIGETLMRPASYRQLETDVQLKNGLSTRYGLGVQVISVSGHRALKHGGEVSGFTAENVAFPDDHAAIAVLANQDAADAAAEIASKITPLLFAGPDAASTAKLEQARKIFAGLQQGMIDRSLLTEDANSYFSEQALKDFESGLAPLGTPQEFRQVAHELRGGMSLRVYSVRFPNKSLKVWTYELPDGKLEQYQVAPE